MLSSYTVREDEQQIDVCVVIDDQTRVAVDFMIEFSTMSGTAGESTKN